MTQTAAPHDVLVIDDDPAISRALRRVLAAQGTVRCAATASEALALIEARVPHVVVSDYQLDQDTAAELLRTVKRRWPDVRCILYSASSAQAWVELVRDGILEAAVVKPAPVAEILERIESRPR